MGTVAEEAKSFISTLKNGPSHDLTTALAVYEGLHTLHGGDESSRKQHYDSMVNFYYDVATAFYEYAWGPSFHFASRLYGETFQESIKRHEHYIALHLGLKPGMKVLDVGCGIGGPLREIANFSGASITGLNNNGNQIKRGIVLNQQFGLTHLCDFLKADFMQIPMPDDSYDAIYNLEACCHAPDLVSLYKELYRVLKPGQCLAGFDWCMTKHYDPQSSIHKSIKAEIEYGNGLPDIRTTTEYMQALKDAGFQILMEEDKAEVAHVPWYEPLNPQRLSISTFRTTGLGRFLGRKLLWMMELSHLVPKGSLEVSQLLERSGHGLLLGGRLKIFTPIYFFLAQKPHL
ncbi:hypothetical protein GOP47_0027981 [Adiantum capillus-veneris]|nr:hypothetical protein GOP47_0027594 [Adiantum capillus-veneris]KAI5057966.1 hypothetical protein GOP47_0027981 [Adiantum capillus-veneris]